MSQTQRQFTRGALTAGALQIGAMGTGFVAQLLYARWMSQEAFGVFSQVNAALVLTANLVIIGVPITNLQLLPTFVQQRDWGRWRGLMTWGVRRVALLSTAVGVAWCLAVLVQETGPAWALGGLLLPITAVIAVQQTQALGFKNVVLARFPSEILRPAGALALFAGALAAGARPDATAAMVGLLVSSALITGILAARIDQLSPPEAHEAEPVVESTRWTAISGEFFGQGFFAMVLDRADLLAVGWFLGAADAAVYAVVIMLAKLLLLALGAVNTIAAPMFADLYAQKRLSEVQDLLALGVKAATAVALLTGLGLALAAAPALSLFGDGYAAGAVALWITLVGTLVNAACGSAGNIVGMSGHQHITWRVLGAAAAAMLALDALLIPTYGIEGAALARTLAMAGWNLALATYANRVLGLDPTVLSAFRSR